MKRTIAVLLTIVLCCMCCLEAGAEEIQPRWKMLSIMTMTLSPYNGLYNNAEVQAAAGCYSHDVRLDMSVVITKWNGQAYEDTDKSWSRSENGATDISKKFRLEEGNYVARVTVTLYDKNGAYIETVTEYSNDIVI